MQITGSSHPLTTRAPNAPSAPARPQPTHPSVVRPSARPAAPAPSPSATSAAPAKPATVDPRLWDVLSSDERAHFSEIGAMGPLSYGSATATARTLAPRGRRLSAIG